MRITDRATIKAYYQALLDRQQSYVGTFFVGVTTTGVFCIPTCRARKPKFENVKFYTSFESAIGEGFRPCKVCKPTEDTCVAPEGIQRAMALVRERPKQKISDNLLRSLDISPSMVRRWFKMHYGMTFQAYQRTYRINIAYQELEEGMNVTDTAFKFGYESLSGFGYTFKKVIGNSPGATVKKNIILLNRFTTPLGPMFVCATDRGICLLEFVDSRMLETKFSELQRCLDARILVGENAHVVQAIKEVEEYFCGTRFQFDVALQMSGTIFQNQVWRQLTSIPFGNILTYQQLADTSENPNVAKAVAKANSDNRISIIVPCHRVVGVGSSSVSYSGGLKRKEWLLEHEKRFVAKIHR